ncbi:MAG: DUF2281 domain-containing protein [Chitinophagaceae bacterium]|nr:DUF2281 domain-containing protein [Chitinophagaceae bacterium]
MDNTLLYSKLTSLPENMKSEVSDFIDFHLSKSKKITSKKKPKFGSGKGMFTMKKTFDKPIEDFKDYI